MIPDETGIMVKGKYGRGIFAEGTKKIASWPCALTLRCRDAGICEGFVSQIRDFAMGVSTVK